jgi:hypothetical protein
MSNPLKTADEIQTACAAAREFIARHHLCLDATIDDYPIGRQDRGKCGLQVVRKKNHGYRLVRTTTRTIEENLSRETISSSRT